MDRILVVDPDPVAREAMERLGLARAARFSLAASAAEALGALEQFDPDLVVLDLDLPDVGGMGLLDRLRARDGRLPVIVTAGEANTEDAIQATKLGAFDYVLKPWDPGEMAGIINRALESGRLVRSPVTMDQGQPARGEALVGRSRPMQEIYKAIGRVAPTDATVLIRGESGTGKELVARAIFQHSDRTERPFVVVNCVAIPETLLESELFGYERGAFTGATARKIGRIELAHRGTVFLDEIGDMPLSLQSKLLRLLQDRSIERLGGRGPIAVDVRIIAATNRPLEEAMAEGRFREDLYYRLNVVSLNLPPLRERAADVPLLAEYFLARAARELGVRNPGLTPEAGGLLAAHSWPGNVRELANAMEQCLIFSRGGPVGTEEVAALLQGQKQEEGGPGGAPDEALRRWIMEELALGRTGVLQSLTDHLARLIVDQALRSTGGNRTRAAALLGVSRPTLLAKIDKYGLADQ